MKIYTDLSTASKLDIIEEARTVLNGTYRTTGELSALYKQLEKMDQFAYATEVLLVKMQQDEKEGIQKSTADVLKEHETLAKYIYKDHALPSHFKFDRALRELQNHGRLYQTNRCETLGIAGAVYKRKWQFDHAYKNLILARYYYHKGFLNWKECLAQPEAQRLPDQDDKGYTAINYAYINELMAVDNLEEHGKVTGVNESILNRFKEADQTRIFILSQFIHDPMAAQPELKEPSAETWVLATIAEAYFGLKKYDQAIHFIRLYLQAKGPLPWETRSFQQQMFSLAYLQMFQKNFAAQYATLPFADKEKVTAAASAIQVPKINECLAAFDRHSDSIAASREIKKDGKFGLALSGGGFRASLYHIGVLAALAEKDELKNVEVISCVSGGSIIGAYYYLKLKMLLETKTDDEISRQDYIQLVQDIERDFLDGVQQNLRMRIFSHLGSNFKMFSKAYSRTHRLGELYEEHLYSRILKDVENYNQKHNSNYQLIPKENNGRFYMHDLFITPKGSGENFTPITGNWKRKNKIPQLVLNATSVNTGHNWQFTASWMGEPPGNIQVDIDAKPRLRRMYYGEAPGDYKKFSLGFAVGASSCVPVMFHPMPMPGLYEGIDLQLVDGGLHDNQGIGTLLEQECNQLFISDASGQLPTNQIATGDGPAIFMRSDNILQERLRELQFQDIEQRNQTSQITRLYKVHLKKNLQERPVNWVNCNDPARTLLNDHFFTNTSARTSFGIDRRVQRLLSEIRTDLDSFNDKEAYALMYNGYVQTMFAYSRQGQPSLPEAEDLWQFASIKPLVTDPAKFEEIEKPLSIGKDQFLKMYRVSKPLRYGIFAIAAIALLALVMAVVQSWDATLSYSITVKALVWILVILVIGFFSRWLAMLLNIKGTIKKYGSLAMLAVFGYAACNIYLWWFNDMYNNSGKMPKRKKDEPVINPPSHPVVTVVDVRKNDVENELATAGEKEKVK